MSIEITLAIAVVSTCFAIYQIIVSIKRNRTTDLRLATSELTTVIVKLENISTSIGELKHDLGGVKNDIKDVRERVIKTEESTKAAHRRLDCLEQLYNNLATTP